jgi:hypothetical protein
MPELLAPSLAASLAEAAATGVHPCGWDPASVSPEWEPALAAAGVPFAAGGKPWEAEIVPALTQPVRTPDGRLQVPPLALFATLTSLPLKALRAWIDDHFSIRVQLGVGVHVHLWSNQLVLVNPTAKHRGGFLHGPKSGMRTVVALDPGQVQRITW